MAINIAILVGIGLLAAYIVARIAIAYATSTGTKWERLRASAMNSASILKEMVTALGAMILVWADQAAQFFNMPEVQQFMKDHFTPTMLGTAATVIAVIGILARLRTLKR